MKYLKWLLSIILFLMMLGFAVKNDDLVILRYFFGYEWQIPLVVVLLIFFMTGIVLGMLAMMIHIFRLRTEIYSLKKELKSKTDDQIH